MNDNVFIFKKLFYEKVVLEDIFLGLFVLIVEVFDLDVGFNGMISYFFVSNFSVFIIDVKIGVIIIIVWLDCEKYECYMLSIGVKDYGNFN